MPSKTKVTKSMWRAVKYKFFLVCRGTCVGTVAWSIGSDSIVYPV